jgi:hypothetical protein
LSPVTERLLDPGAGCPTLAVEGIKLLALPAHQMLLLPLAGCGLRERERKEEEEGGSAADGPDLGHRPSQLPPPELGGRGGGGPACWESDEHFVMTAGPGPPGAFKPP